MSEPGVSLRTYVRTVQRHWLRCALLALGGLGLGLLGTVLSPVTYYSTAVVFTPDAPEFLAADVRPDEDAEDPRPRLVTQDTEAQIIRSGLVRSRVAALLGDSGDSGDTSGLAERLDITVPTSTRVLHIRFAAGDASTAQRGAQVVAEEYARVRSAMLADRGRRIESALRQRRDSVQVQLDAARSTVASLDATSPARAAMRTRVGQLTAQIKGIDRGLAEAGTSIASRADVVQNARLPRRPDRGNAEVPPVSGLALGLVAGLSWGHLHDRRRRRVLDIDDVRRATGLPVLRADARRLGTEVQVADAHRLLITGLASEPVVDTLAGQLRQTLVRAGETVEVDLAPDGPESAGAVRAAAGSDLVLLVAELDHSGVDELTRVTRLLTTTGTTTAIVVESPS